MSTHNKTLHLLSSKLGLGEEEKVISKAAEFERLLQTKSIAGSNMSDTSKVKTTIKYSGLKSSMYTNSKKVIQNLLELESDKMTTSLLCAALQCTGSMEVDVHDKEEPLEPEIEPYEDWKRRMLEAAYKELRELEEKEKCKPKRLDSHRDSLTPRRSPRKTPQKFSPYKSPAKINGVRLLFQ
ncbi:Origin recognition complex subunit 6 [Operophtera brumata]|uniref:Origin recognition complex subunit 6 n=1 Tax=Operophtera brumata TaxID=104452 RepID=A0A0L7KTV3_OPEBR|nr:Origin recognition complex subunit 6 [Operophtera brumata]